MALVALLAALSLPNVHASQVNAAHGRQLLGPADDQIEPGSDAPKGVAALRNTLSLAAKVGQMSMRATAELIDYAATETAGVPVIDEALLAGFVEEGVGCFLDNPTSGGSIGKLVVPTTAQWQKFTAQIQEAFRAAGKLPPIIAIDSMHGAGYIKDAVMYPHALHVAASWNPQHTYHATRSAARHTRRAGVQWVFSPVLDVVVAARFPRVYETVGEDPRANSVHGVASVQGLQGMHFDTTCEQRTALNAPPKPGARTAVPSNLTSPEVVAATAKHFVAYQASRSNYDRAPAWLPETIIRQHLAPPFWSAIKAGVATVMTSYNEPEATPTVISREWTRQWLRGAAQFDGLVLTDWDEVYNQVDWHYTAANGLQAVVQALQRTSIDMSMVPYKPSWVEDVIAAVRRGYVSESRLDIAVDRILELKARVGLLQGSGGDSGAALEPAPLAAIVATGEIPEAEVAREDAQSLAAAIEGVVLLKNENDVLPLGTAGNGSAAWQVNGTVAVIGPSAQSSPNLLGGWSIHWQGAANNEEAPFPTLADALEADGVDVAAATGVLANGTRVGDGPVVTAREATAAIIFAYGEGHYAEVFGNVPNGRLPAPQLRVARRLRRVAQRRGVPFIGVYIGGRDRLLRDFDVLFDAHLTAFYPGPHGGAALSQVLRGEANPSGRLPITLNAGSNQVLPYWHARSDYDLIPDSVAENIRRPSPPLYNFTHGLSYTTWETTALWVSTNRNSFPEQQSCPLAFTATDSVFVRATIKNTGQRSGKWPVVLLVEDRVSIVPPSPPVVKGFTIVELGPGKQTFVDFQLVAEDFSFVADEDITDSPGSYIQPGIFNLHIGELQRKVQLAGDPLVQSDWVKVDLGLQDVDLPSVNGTGAAPQYY